MIALLLSLLACGGDEKPAAPAEPAAPAPTEAPAAPAASAPLPEAAARTLADLRMAAASARAASSDGRLADIHPLSEQIGQLAARLPTEAQGIPADQQARLTQQALAVKQAAEKVHVAADNNDAAGTTEALGSLDKAVAELPAYVCPMHPEVCQADPGRCPKCGMNLEKAGSGGAGGHGGSDHMAQMAKTRDGLKAALGAAYDQPVAGLDKADREQGKTLYGQHCASCHGEAGKGDGAAGAALSPPPGDLTDAAHARYYTDAGRVQIIRKGSSGTGMPGFEGALDEQQILNVYAYIADLRGEAEPAGHGEGGHDHGAHDHGH